MSNREMEEENTFEYDKYMNFETYDTFKSNFNKICVIKETLEHMAIVLNLIKNIINNNINKTNFLS